jgi:anti-anti-sigma factor
MDEPGESPDGGLGIEIHHPRHGVTLVVLRGAIDAAAVPVLEERLTTAARTDPAERRRVVLDLAGVTALTEEGVEVLLATQEQVTSEGRTVELLMPSPSVIMMLHEAAAGYREQPATG